MKKYLLLFVIASVAKQSFSQGVWTQKADFGGGARKDAVGFSIGNKGYIGTGVDSIIGYANDFWEFDPSTNIWTQKANFSGTPRASAVGFSIALKGYIGTGYNDSNYYNDFWEYNSSNDNWTQKANFGGSSRVLATGFSIGNKGYIGTGYIGGSSATYYNDFWEYDTIANNWTQKISFPGTGRGPSAGFSIGNKGYLGTGNDSVGPTNDFWEYNSITGTWTQKANLPASRCGSSGFSISNKGYIGIGQGPFTPFYNEFWEYDSSTNIWIQIANYGGTGRANAVSFSINGKGYVGTGYRYNTYSGFLKDFWEFDPNGNTVNDINLENLISVYPNPSKGKIQVQSHKSLVLSLKTYNAFGECVSSFSNDSRLMTIDLNLSSQPNGVYFVNIKTDKGHVAKKIILQK